MKRNILKAGRSSLAVSIPKVFAKNNDLKPGKEVDVNFHGKILTITCETPKKIEKTIDLRDIGEIDNYNILDKILGILFKQGTDSYKLILPSAVSKDIIRKILHNGKLNMYEKPGNMNSNIIEVESPIRNFDDESLRNMISVIIKNIFVTLEEYSELLLKDELSKKVVEEIYSRDSTINEYADICRRIIIKNLTDHTSVAEYMFIDYLEKIGDLIKNMVVWSYDNKNIMKKNLKNIQNIRDCLYLIYSNMNHFSIKKISSFYSQYEKYVLELDSCNNPYLYHYLKSTLLLIKEIHSALLMKYI